MRGGGGGSVANIPVAEGDRGAVHLRVGILHDEHQAHGVLGDIVPLQGRRHVVLGSLSILRVLGRNAVTVLERPARQDHRPFRLHLCSLTLSHSLSQTSQYDA